jgi:hypothetical protein
MSDKLTLEDLERFFREADEDSKRGWAHGFVVAPDTAILLEELIHGGYSNDEPIVILRKS